jgi:hypothetical protein
LKSVTTQDIPQDWQNIIWREWYNCEDKLYARLLFALVADERTGWAATIISAVIGVLFGTLWGIGGLLVTYLVGLVIVLSNRPIALGSSNWMWVWGVIGGGAGYWMWLLLKRRLSWQVWLRWLIPRIPVHQLTGEGLNWLGQRLFFGLALGLGGSLLGLILEVNVGQGIIGPEQGWVLVIFLVGLMSISLIWGWIVGYHDGLILGTIGWLGAWLSVSLIFILAAWQVVGLISLVIAALVVLIGVVGPFLMTMLLRLPLLEVLDPPRVKANIVYFIVISGLGYGLSLTAQLATGDEATLILFRFLGLHFEAPVIQLNKMLGLLGWLVAGLGTELGVLLSTLKLKRRDGSLEYEYRRRFFWWKDRPYISEVTATLTQVPRVPVEVKESWTEVMNCLERMQSTDTPEPLIKFLRSPDWIERLTASHALVMMGGEAIAALGKIVTDKDPALRPTAIWILHSIGYETTIRLAHQADNLLCHTCLTCCTPGSVEITPGDSFTYYGCRLCRQTRAFWDGAKGAVAVLDANMTDEVVQQDGLVRVNWLARRTLFDFDRVEIVQATDEDVERFAVQIGNDTDPFRKRYYQQMRCVVKAGCKLSENTLRILQHTFG